MQRRPAFSYVQYCDYGSFQVQYICTIKIDFLSWKLGLKCDLLLKQYTAVEQKGTNISNVWDKVCPFTNEKMQWHNDTKWNNLYIETYHSILNHSKANKKNIKFACSIYK